MHSTQNIAIKVTTATLPNNPKERFVLGGARIGTCNDREANNKQEIQAIQQTVLFQ